MGTFYHFCYPPLLYWPIVFNPPDFRGENTNFGVIFGQKPRFSGFRDRFWGSKPPILGVQTMILGPWGVQSCPKGAQSMVPQAHFGSRGGISGPPKPRFLAKQLKNRRAHCQNPWNGVQTPIWGSFLVTFGSKMSFWWFSRNPTRIPHSFQKVAFLSFGAKLWKTRFRDFHVLDGNDTSNKGGKLVPPPDTRCQNNVKSEKSEKNTFLSHFSSFSLF